MRKIEKRTLSVELRAESQGDEMALVGYAALFNSLSKDLGNFREIIAPGAFTRSLNAEADVKCLFNHDPNQILGRTKNGSLTLKTDDHGLAFRCVINPDDSAARAIYARIARNDVSSCSFAFTVPAGGDSLDEATDENGQRFTRRTLRDVNLMDVSAVTYPAYDGTNVDARSLADYSTSPAQLRARLDRVNDQIEDELRRDKARRLGAVIRVDEQRASEAASDREMRKRMRQLAGITG